MIYGKQARTWSIVVVLVLLAWTTGSVRTAPTVAAPLSQALTPLLQYQGRLTDPATGAPVPDGVYAIRFRLYNGATGGTHLWSEHENVPVEGGLLSTVLGDSSALDASLFNGQALWLGVQVGADAEATPRQPVLPVAYALSLVPGAVMQASSGPVLEVNRTGGGEALRVGGDLNVSRVRYASPRTHHLIIGSEGFLPARNAEYENAYGSGGAWIDTAGCEKLVAPVHLPHGATMTAFKAYYQDESSGDLRVSLDVQFMDRMGYASIAVIETSGTPGYDSQTETLVDSPAIDNTQYSYLVQAHSCNWDRDLRIRGAMISYTIDEAP
jgi:hypothetical protein